MTDDYVDAESVVCRNSDCRVAENGGCVEGFELGDCPHYVGDALDESDGGSVAEKDEAAGGVESVRLASADALRA